MKNLLYIGNKLLEKGATPTSIETLGEFLKKEGFRIKTASGKKNKLLRLIDMLYHLSKYKKTTDFVLIDTYSTTNFYYAVMVSQLSRLLNLNYIPILRGGNLEYRLKSSPKLSRNLFGNAHVNVAPSKFTASVFQKHGYSNLVCIPNTIEIKKYPFKARTFEEINLLWVRSFSEIYNPLLAIHLLKALKDEGIKASLCMVGPEGDGSLKQAKYLAEQLHVAVRFTGKLSKEEWVDLSKDYNIFINTTHFDNMPVSVIETMALGLPIVSTNVGGLPFLIDNGNEGVLVSPDDVKAFVSALKMIQNEPHKALDMATKARKKVEQFDWELVKEQWKTLLG